MCVFDVPISSGVYSNRCKAFLCLEDLTARLTPDGAEKRADSTLKAVESDRK